MAATALAQEKVWVDKPSYDKAERLHFERLAKLGTYCKLLSINSMDQCSPDSVFADPQNQINSNPSSNTKSKKSKKNKSPVQDKGSDIFPKNPKCQAKNAKVDKNGEKCITEKMECAEKIDMIESKVEETGLISEDAIKYKPKEAKEKKNKADKKHRNKEEVKNNAEQQIEQSRPFEQGSPQSTNPILPASGSLANEVAKARQHIKKSLQCMDGITALASGPNQEIASRLAALERENQDLKNIVNELVNVIARLDERVKFVEEGGIPASLRIAICPPKPEDLVKAPAVAASPKEDDDDNVDLFGSDSEGEDTDAAKIREERLAAYAAKKSKKPTLIAKSNIILDVKPWDDETDMKAMETEVRKIETDGLLWGAAKLVPLAYGIHKLQISCVVEDDKVSIDWLTEQIEAIEDFVQSVDIAAFNKV